MDVDRLRALLLSLPHVVETMQWGDNLVFWVGDKAIGGKMFALIALDADLRANQPVISFAAGPSHFAALLEHEGCRPAPYFARIHWIAATSPEVFTAAEWEEHLRRAGTLTLEKLARKTRALLELPPGQLKRHVTAARKAVREKQASLRVRKVTPAGATSRRDR